MNSFKALHLEPYFSLDDELKRDAFGKVVKDLFSLLLRDGRLAIVIGDRDLSGIVKLMIREAKWGG